MISTKTHYVRTDGWRGYVEPIDAIAGANDTGDWNDSPCPSDVCKTELGKVKSELKKAKIKYKSMATNSANVFCLHRYILVAKEDKKKSLKIVEKCLEDTILLYKV